MNSLQIKKAIFSIFLLFTVTSGFSQNNIFEAIETGNIREIQNLINQKTDLNIIDSALNQTPLMYAVDKGNFKIVKLLVESGAKLDSFKIIYNEWDTTEIESQYTYNALNVAVNTNKKLITKYLSRNYDIYTIDTKNKNINVGYISPLEVAIENNNYNLISVRP